MPTLVFYYIPFILQSVSQLEDLHLNFPAAVVLQNFLVRLALSVLEVVVVFGVGSGVVAVLQQGQIALDVARRTATPWGRETDVGRHVGMAIEVVVFRNAVAEVMRSLHESAEKAAPR
jgi:hypothetical protein